MSLEECADSALSVVITSFSDFYYHGHLELIGSRDSREGREVPEEPFVAVQVQGHRKQCLYFPGFGRAVPVNRSAWFGTTIQTTYRLSSLLLILAVVDYSSICGLIRNPSTAMSRSSLSLKVSK
jgi:hypothetical protein